MFDTYTHVYPQRIIEFEFPELASSAFGSGAARTVCRARSLGVKTQVYTYYSVVPPLPNNRLGLLERSSSRISHRSGDQVTQGCPPRPRVPGPPSSPRLLNEQAPERKLRRSLPRVISFQIGWNHRQGANTPLGLIPPYLAIAVESRSTGYQPKGWWLKGGLVTDVTETIPPKPCSQRQCRARHGLCADYRIQATVVPRGNAQGVGVDPAPRGGC